MVLKTENKNNLKIFENFRHFGPEKHSGTFLLFVFRIFDFRFSGYFSKVIK